jgi:hypothetical protein
MSNVNDLTPRSRLTVEPGQIAIRRLAQVTYENSFTTQQVLNTFLTADALTGHSSITVDSIEGFRAGDYITIILDNGGLHNTQVSSVVGAEPGESEIALVDAMPSQASAGNRVEMGLAEVAQARGGQVTLADRLVSLDSVFHVELYGGIQAAINAANATGGGTVLLKSGETYTVTISGGKALTIYPNITIDGNGATIRLVNAAGNYETIFSGATAGADLSNLTIKNLTIDQNATNNTVTSTGQLSGNPRFAIRIYAGRHIRIQDCTFRDIQAVNTVVANGATVSDVHITNCKFHGVGGADVDFDHSTIYTNCADAIISGNIFTATSVLANGARTAIETHGSRQSVIGNQVYGFMIGGNITGVYQADSVGNVISDNSITDCRFGFIVWSQQYMGHTTGYGIDGLVIEGNHVKLVEPANRPDGGAVGGIIFDWNSDLPSRNITIANNVIWSELETSEKAANTASLGIGWYSVGNMGLSNITITGNVITNFPTAAIRLSVGSLDNCIISDNIIKNPGSTLNNITAAFKSGVVLITATGGTMRRVKVANNIITDDIDTSRMVYGIYVNSATASHDVELLWNSVDVTGSTTTSFLAPFWRAGNNTNVLLIGSYEGFTPPVSVFVSNSRVWDRTGGVVWECVENGTTWVTRSYGLAAPSAGTWRRGDIVWNYSPAASGTVGWICVTAGSPGTWKTWGTIAA